jgi:hypothetical protein
MTIPDFSPIRVCTYSSALALVDCAFLKTKNTLLETEQNPRVRQTINEIFGTNEFCERFKLLILYKAMLLRQDIETNPDIEASLHSIDLKMLFVQAVRETTNA